MKLEQLVRIVRVDEPERVMQRFDAIESAVFCKGQLTSHSSRGLDPGCALALTDAWIMKDEKKHVAAVKQLRDTSSPTKLRIQEFVTGLTNKIG